MSTEQYSENPRHDDGANNKANKIMRAVLASL